jgi:hypothetical protein
LHELPPDRKKKSFLPLNSQPAEHTPKFAPTYMGKPWKTADLTSALWLVVVSAKQPRFFSAISSSLRARRAISGGFFKQGLELRQQLRSKLSQGGIDNGKYSLLQGIIPAINLQGLGRRAVRLAQVKPLQG